MNIPDGWNEMDNKIIKKYEFEDFNEAMSFVNKVAKVANKYNHHPDILVHNYNQVELTVTTHDKGKVTIKDIALAKEIDEISLEAS